jgi:hypothetical protein
MRSKRSKTRLWTFGSIALGVAALALIFTALFSSTDAAAQGTQSDIEAENAAADTVAVTITGGAIDVPQNVDAGETVFKVTNDGQEAHGFAIGSDLTSPAEVASLESKLEAGQSETLTAKLEPGTYMAYLPTQDSQGQGEEQQAAQVSAQFTVEEQPSTMK